MKPIFYLGKCRKETVEKSKQAGWAGETLLGPRVRTARYSCGNAQPKLPGSHWPSPAVWAAAEDSGPFLEASGLLGGRRVLPGWLGACRCSNSPSHGAPFPQGLRLLRLL